MFKKVLSSLNRERARLVVAGNSSVDLDSVVSSICYSYFYNVYHNTNTCLPFLDISSDELRLRKDVVHVLHRFDIEAGSLLFKEDLKCLPKDIKLVLVDHNLIQDKLLLPYEVSLIIDHHVDEGSYMEADPRIIERTGSCSSLVFNYWYNLISQSKEKDQLDVIFGPMAEFALSPILMDTSSMAQKVEDADIEAVKNIKSFSSFDLQTFYNEIHEEKLNIEGLSVYELLQKDYKMFHSPTYSIGVGFSSLAKSLEFILHGNAKDEQGFVDDVIRFTKDNQLSVLVLMSSFQDKDFEREIAIYSSSDVKPIIPLIKDILQLQEKFKIADLIIYQQLNTKASRKQVLPLIKSILN